MNSESETISSDPMHLSFGALYTAKNEFCSSGIFSSLSHFSCKAPFPYIFAVWVFFSFGMGCLSFSLPTNCFAKHFFFPVCKAMRSLRSKVDRLRRLKNHLTLPKLLFSSWRLYTSHHRTEGTTLTSPSTPATIREEAQNKKKN